MAKPVYKLHYFDGKGRAEGLRLLFAAAGQPYEDIRYSQEEWPKHKHLTPFGQVPCLQIDDKFYAQSVAIKQYAAREFGFYGKTNLDQLRIDQVVQLLEDLINIAVKAMFSSGGPSETKEAIEKVKKNESPRFLGYLEKLLKENGTGYFVGNGITLADINTYDLITGMTKDLVDISDFPLLQANVKLVEANKGIGKYVASRGPTAF